MSNTFEYKTQSEIHDAPQVFWATQYYKYTGTGNERKLVSVPRPNYQRSFISFSFGGIDIEEFGLIAYCDGSTMERAGSAEFEDLTSSYDILDGESYHGTHFKPFQLSLSLATDGMTQKQLEKFKSWFRGGITRDLVLAEHPNRFICARLQSPPQFHVIPFEHSIRMPAFDRFDGEGNNIEEYYSVTTLYKGTISLTFISSDPFWRAYGHVIGEWGEQNQFLNTWHNYNLSSDVNAHIKKEVSKIIYEDNIPIPVMLDNTCRLSFGWTGTEMKIGNATVSTGSTSLESWNSTNSTRSLSNSKGTKAGTSNDTSTLKNNQRNILTIEKAHRPLALPEGSDAFSKYDTIVAIEKNVAEDGEAQPGVAGEFKWWWPWGSTDTIEAAEAADPNKEQQISLRGARVMAGSVVETDDQGFLIKCFVASNSRIVDAYDYPQVLAGELIEDEEDEDDDDEDAGNRNVQTRGLIKAENTNSNSSTSSDENAYYFFYGGTAPSPAKISFKLPLTFHETKALKDKRKITSIASSTNKKKGKTYSSIIIDGIYRKEISMTMPNIMTSYNKVINIISKASGKNVVDLQDKIRDEIRHPYVRAYALKALAALIAYRDPQGIGSYVTIPENVNDGSAHNPTAESGEPDRRVWADMMQSFWINNDTDELIEIIIDSNTSKATGTFKFRINPTFTIIRTVDPNNQYWLTFENGNVDKILEVTEDIGDAMRSSWYYIDDRNEYYEERDPKTNILNKYLIKNWENTSIETRSYSHKVTSDFPVNLKDFYIDYEYMYL